MSYISKKLERGRDLIEYRTKKNIYIDFFFYIYIKEGSLVYDSFARMSYKMDTTKQYTTKISTLTKILKERNTKLKVPPAVVRAEPGYYLTRNEWEERKISEKLESFFKKKAEKSKNPKNPLLLQKDFLLNLSKFPKSKFSPNIYELPLLVDDNALFFESNFESGNLKNIHIQF